MRKSKKKIADENLVEEKNKRQKLLDLWQNLVVKYNNVKRHPTIVHVLSIISTLLKIIYWIIRHMG